MTTLNGKDSKAHGADFAALLLKWYDRHARPMPWRMPPAQSKQGLRSDPYHTWLSEVMLQQTQVATVGKYFLKFVAKWPSISDLASADTEDVMKAWAGLGYYSRARNLKKCAEIIVSEHNGRYPQNITELKKLDGIGEYTAAAIAAIAFNQPVAVIDGNVERVIARLYRIRKPLRQAKPEIHQIVSKLLCKKRPGDFAQAMMDLGATLCSPKKPACSLCPVAAHCAAFANADMEAFPVKASKKAKPTRKGAAFIIINNKGAVFLRKRKTSGLLGGMSEVPTSDWNSRRDGVLGVGAAPFKANWKSCRSIKHGFTHFHLELEVWKTECEIAAGAGWWSEHDQIANEALPTVMKKAIEAGLAGASRLERKS